MDPFFFNDEIKTLPAFGLLSVAVHSQLSLYESIDIMNAPTITTEQHRDQNNDDQSRKSPAQQEVEQIASLSVLVIHHQGLPEVHGLGKATYKMSQVRKSDKNTLFVISLNVQYNVYL